MLQKALLFIVILFITNCAGTIRIAEEDVKSSTTPTQNIVAKPKE